MKETLLNNSGIDPKKFQDMLVGLNRLRLNRIPHIKKYNKLRILHSEILDSMENYVENGNYSIQNCFNILSKNIEIETKGLDFRLNPTNEDDMTILRELFMYKNHNKIPSITDVFIDKKKFRNKEKVKMLHSMKNSYVGLFKVVKTDFENGYVYYEDVFTHKRFKIIDIAMSSSYRVTKDKTLYLYNRIITYDDISFATGIHCMLDSDNKYLKEFLKKHRYKSCSDFSRCLMLYDISKKGDRIAVNYNNKYGNRR